MAVQTFSVKSQGNIKIADNFKVSEFRCKDGSDIVLLDVDFVKSKLQLVRDHFKKPVTVTSGYRTSSYNIKCGGVKNSYHLKGRAFDIIIKGIDLMDIAKYAESIDVFGIIVYPNKGFVHIDSRTTKYFSKDSGKTECSTFGGISSPTSAPVYVIGNTYVLQNELKVRTGPGTSYPAKEHGHLTSGGKSSDKDKDGALDKGTKVTCQKIEYDGEDIWLKCPSGWIAAYYKRNVYVKAL